MENNPLVHNPDFWPAAVEQMAKDEKARTESVHAVPEALTTKDFINDMEDFFYKVTNHADKVDNYQAQAYVDEHGIQHFTLHIKAKP